MIQRCQQQALLAERPCDLDLLIALLDEPELEPLWRATSTNLAQLRADVQEAVAEIDEGTLRASPRLQQLVQGAILHAMGANNAAVDVRMLMSRLWASSTKDGPDPLIELLADHGLTSLTVKTFFAHGVIAHEEWSDATAPVGESLAVELVNDDYTTQEIVVHILNDIVGLEPTNAHQVMLDVHMTGRAPATVLRRNEAIAMANAILAEARSAEVPLKAALAPLIAST